MKRRRDFEKESEYIDYLMTMARSDLPRSAVTRRIRQGMEPTRAITRRLTSKPDMSHPLKRPLFNRMKEEKASANR